jgi:hypothetical protein
MLNSKNIALSLAAGFAAFGAAYAYVRSSKRFEREPRIPADSLSNEALFAQRAEDDFYARSSAIPSDLDLIDFDESRLSTDALMATEELPLAQLEEIEEEHYDAVSPDDLGAEWLSRATEASAPAVRSEPFEDLALRALELSAGRVDAGDEEDDDETSV